MSELTGVPGIDRLLEHAEEVRTRHGNRVRETLLLGDRYLFDSNFDTGRWSQLDTEHDASYFGTWCNKSQLRILQFIEGELYLTLCQDAASFDAELASLCVQNPAAPAFVVIDESSVTSCYQDRRELFFEPERAPTVTEDR